MEVTPTEHGAVIRFRFPADEVNADSTGFNQTRRVLLALNSILDDVSVDVEASTGLLNCSGYTIANSGGVARTYGRAHCV